MLSLVQIEFQPTGCQAGAAVALPEPRVCSSFDWSQYWSQSRTSCARVQGFAPL